MTILISLSAHLSEELATHLPIDFGWRVASATIRDLSMLIVEGLANFRVMRKDSHFLPELAEVVDDDTNVWILCDASGAPFAEGLVGIKCVMLFCLVLLREVLVTVSMLCVTTSIS